MALSKKQKQSATRTGNRIGKSEMGSVVNEHLCGVQATPQRRSIPAKEVQEMLDRQAKQLTKEPTLYDQRIQLIEEIDYHVRQQDMHREAASNYSAGANEKRQQLKEVNRLLSEELKQDPIR